MVILEEDGKESAAFDVLPALLIRIGPLNAKQVNEHSFDFRQHPTTHASKAFALALAPNQHVLCGV